MQVDALKDLIEGSKRIPIQVQNLEVEFFDSSYKRLSAHYRAFERTWMANSLTPTFSEEEFHNYIETIFSLRCQLINGSPKEYSKVIKMVKVPALVYLVLESFGRVEAKDYGLVIVPKWSGNKPKLSEVELQDVSLKLQELEDLGHEMARGLPSGPDGSIDFMMMQVIDEVVRTSIPTTHPVYALLRSFIKVASFQDLVIPRIHFLQQDEYDFQYESLARGRS